MKSACTALLVVALLFASVFAAGAPAAAAAGTGAGTNPFDKWWNDAQLAAMLQLDAATIEKLDAIYLEHGKKLLDLKAALEKNRMDVFSCMEKEPVDVERTRKEYLEVLQDRNAYYLARFDYVLAVRQTIGKERYIRLFEYFDTKWGK